MGIRTRVGETFVIVLDGTPTTGYLWEPDTIASVEFLGRDFDPPSGHAIGAATKERLTFRCSAAGHFTLTLRHRRPWESSARDTRTYTITAV
jgi:predicted secreted protein